MSKQLFNTFVPQKEEDSVVSELRYRRLFETTQDGILILNADSGRIEDVNPSLKQLLGYSQEELIGKQLWEIGVFKDIADSKTAFLKLQTEEHIRYENLPLQTKNGHIINVEFVSNVYMVGTLKVIQCNIRDITERKKVEEAIEVKAKKLENARIAASNVFEDLTVEKSKVDLAKAKDEAMLNSIGDGLIITDKEGKIVMVNPPAEEMTGWKIQDLLGKPIFEAIPMEDEKNEFIPAVQRALNMALSGTTTTTTTTTTSSSSEGGTKIATVYFIRKDKTRFPAAASTAPVCLQNGSIEGAVVVFRDITKEKEADKAKTEFVSLSSHQLRTPLTSINWYSEMLSSLEAGSLNEEQKKYVGEIANSSKRMVKLVAALLDISRIEFGTFAIEPKPINLKEITEIYLKELKPEILKKKLQFTAIYDPSLPVVQVDPKLLGMILTNLLTNSVKYTPAGGQIKLTIDKGESDIKITVSDTGLGIPKEKQSEVFKKLFRADNVREVDPDGTGLGLYIVKGIVDQAGGKIHFESAEGKGTTFYVTFPLSGMKEKEGTKKLS